MNTVPFGQFGNVHQYTTVKAGEESRVFYLKIPDGCVGFIYKLASNYYDGVKWYFYIDGELIVKDLEKTFGDMGNPAEINPPYLVKDRIEFYAKNESSEDLLLEVYCDGVIMHVKTALSELNGGSESK